MRRFVHDTPATRIIFAAGALRSVASEAERLGARRVLLVCGPYEAAWGDTVAADLGDRLADRLREVAQHVPVTLAAAAVERAERVGADLLVSVGGGSATGLAKAVAKELGTSILAVPTTYAGSELTGIWGLTDGTVKSTGRDPRVQPRVVVYDPELTRSLPADLTATSGMNAIAHCVEALYDRAPSPVTLLVAAEGIRVLAAGLPRVVAAPEDLHARAEVLYGALLGGWSLGGSTTGLHHKLAHVLGGALDLPHAATHSVLLPYAVAYSRGYADAALGTVAAALGGSDAAAGLWDLGRRLGTPRSLADVGAPEHLDWIDPVVEAVLAAPPPNPRPVERGPLTALLHDAFGGARP